MEQSTSWVSIYCRDSIDFRILWKPKVHYHVHASTTLGPVLSEINPTHNLSFVSLEYISVLAYSANYAPVF